MVYAKVIGGGLRMRQEPVKTAPVLTLIPNGSRIAITENGKTWAKAVYNQYTGYVMTEFLKIEDDESSDDKTDMVTITLSQETAKALYEALKFSLNF